MQKQLLTNGNAFKRTDGRWGGVVWYKDEKGERKRKSFSGTTKAEVNKKMTDYITKFEEEIIDAIEGNKTVKDSLLNYLQVFKYPNVERVTYDRNEQIYKNQIVPYMGKLIVSNITGADIKSQGHRYLSTGDRETEESIKSKGRRRSIYRKNGTFRKRGIGLHTDF